jgi:small nuclear ribonucleoprotein (snRNP)-like protein
MSYQKYDQNQNAYPRALSSSLKRCLNKKISVAIKIKNHFITGKLIEYDQHLNMILADSVETIVLAQKGENKSIPLKTVIIRGDSVIYIDFEGGPIKPIVGNVEEDDAEEEE